MKDTAYEATTKTAFGYKLSELTLKDGSPAPRIVPIKGKYAAYETFAELQAAKAELSNDEQVKARNAKVLAKEKAAAFKAEFDRLGIEEPKMETSTLLQLTTVYDVLIATGMSHEEAREVASTTVRKPWPAKAKATNDEDEE
jgi:hypothetical protein